MEMEDLMFAHTTRFCKAPLMQFYLGKAFGVLKAKAPKRVCILCMGNSLVKDPNM